ncbi:MAG: hypothetical protein ACK4MH_05135 [Brevundimonas sp.]|uniref:hypothetical protein n=1 Tax=Brevundimonas sp. TaxID=1871086 RepID=UPI003919E698
MKQEQCVNIAAIRRLGYRRGMADGFDIHLNEDQARRLKAAAEAAGVEPTAYALKALEGVIGDISITGVSEYPAAWVAEDAERWAEYERTGVTIPVEDALQDFHANLARRLAEKS